MSTVNVIMLLTRMGKFMYMQAWLTNSIVICMLALHVTTPKHCHCGHGHDLISVAQLSVISIADIRSAFDKTLSSEHFRRNAVDDAP